MAQNQQNMLLWAGLIILGIIVFQSGALGGDTGGDNGDGTGSPGTIIIPDGFLDTVITFESKDMFSPATDAGDQHLILKLGNGGALENVIVSDGGTKTASNGDDYIILVGNATGPGGYTAGTSYYPVLKEGRIPARETFTIAKDQPKTSAGTDLTFTYYNQDETANTPQSLAASAEKTISFKLSAANDKCWGNPDTEAENVICFYHDTAYVREVEATDLTQVSTPNSAGKCNGNTTTCYNVPVLCDNADSARYNLVLKAGTTDPTVKNSINVSFHDVSYYVNQDTLAVEVGVEDEDLNDIGVTDFGVATRCDGFKSILLS